MFRKKWFANILKMIIVVTLFCSNIHTISAGIVYAAELSYYNHNSKSNVNYSGKQITYIFNNKKINMSYPGILISGTALADYEELFVGELGLSATLSDKKITITDGKTELILTVGSKTVKLNGKSQKMSVAPQKLEFENDEVKYYVPTRFVAETFGFNYVYDSKNSEVLITKTIKLSIDNKLHLYNDAFYSVTYNNKTFSFELPVISYKNTIYAPAEQIFNALECDYKAEELISVTKNNVTYQFQKNSCKAAIEDVSLTLDVPLIEISIQDGLEKISYIPLENILKLMGYQITYNENNYNFYISDTEYTGKPELHPELKEYFKPNIIQKDQEPINTYFLWSSEEISDVSGVKNLTKLRAYSIKNADVLELYGVTKEDVNDFIDNRALVIELDSVVSNMDTQFYADFNAPHLNYVLLTTINNNTKLFIMIPIEDEWLFEETEECLKIYFLSSELTMDDLKIYEEIQNEHKIITAEEKYPEDQLIIPFPEGFVSDSVSIQDNYLEQNIQIYIPGNLTGFYAKNKPFNPYDFINNIEIVFDAKTNQTIITCQTSTICGFEQDLSNSFMAIKMGKPAELYDRIIVLDAGHGGKDPGAVRNNIYEKDITLDIVNYTDELFNNTDIKVYCTRTKDKYLSLQERTNFVKEVNADIFVSLHINASELESARGTEVYYSKANNSSTKYGLTSNKIAKTLVNKLYIAMDTKLRGVLNNDYYVVHYNSVPAVLIELGFISNPEERKKLTNKSYQKNAAKAIYESIIEIFCAYPTER